MSKFLRCLAAVAGLVMMASCGGSSSYQFKEHYNPTFTTIDTTGIEVKKLVVGMECNYAPFNWTDSKDNDYNLPVSNAGGRYADGYDVQMAHLLGKALNLEVEIVKEEWESLVPDVQSGTINLVLAGMTDTEERRESVDFSDEYYRSELVLVTSKSVADANTGILTSDQLKTLLNDKNIVSQVSTVTNDVIDHLHESFGANHLSALDTFATCATDVVNGSAFAMTAEYPVAQSIVASNPDKLGIVRMNQDVLGVDLSELGVSVGIKKEQPVLKKCLNAALACIDQNMRNTMMSDAVTRSAE